MNSNRKLWPFAAGIVAGGALVGWAWINRRLFYVNDITTGESTAYPELRSRIYYADTAKALNAAEQSLRRLSGWKLTAKDTENDIIEAEALGSFLLPPDEVTVYFFPIGHSQTQVKMRSRSSQGGGDFGRNAAHIRRLQTAMDDRLNADSAF